MRFVFELRLEDGSVHRYSKSTDRIFIGRASVNDLVLASDLVSAQHALIDGSGGVAVLSDMNSTNGTFLNGNRVVEPSTLKVGDVIAFGIGGSAIAVISLEAEVRAPRTMPMPMRRDDLLSQKQVVRVGRAADNDLVLEDPSVSGHHARVVLDRPGHGFVEDLQSTNGVAVGGLANRVTRGEFGEDDVVFFGSAAVPAAKLLAFSPEPIVLSEAVAAQKPPAGLWVIGAVAAGSAMLVALLVLAIVFLRGRTPPVAAADSVARTAPSQPPAQSPAPPPPQPAAPAIAAPVRSFTVAPADPDKLAERCEPAIVWIGVKIKDDLFPHAAAWAVKPTLLVTTAAAAAALEKASHEPDMKVVAWSNDSLIPVTSFETDPQYSTADPVSDASLRHNVGLVHLENPVATTLKVSPTEKRLGLGPSTPLVLVGFYSTASKPNDLYDRVKLPFSHAALTIASAENDRPGVVPLYGVDLGTSRAGGGGRWLYGAPVVSAEGTVVGILSTGSKERLVSIDPALWNGGSSH
jgi:pSer/pThr/pTyr-binding forkhead associated (FHA) protein